MRATVLIVDDEPLARRRLARMIAAMPGVTLAGVAEDAEDAEAQVRALRPDILLLDIQMPGASGFDLVERLGPAAPVVIFVTAFDHHALRAFDARAADYVTKPVEAGRLAAAIGRALLLARAGHDEERLAELGETVTALRAALREHERATSDFWVKTRGGHVRVPAAQVLSIEAERDYVRLHTGQESYLLHESMASLERRLDPDDFLRVHRSAIVRRDQIVAIRHAPFAALIAVLEGGREIRVGRTYAARVRQLI